MPGRKEHSDQLAELLAEMESMNGPVPQESLEEAEAAWPNSHG